MRAYHLGTPVAKPPAQGYIFDEHYYVSAARVIAGEPTTKGDVYTAQRLRRRIPTASIPSSARS